MSDRLTYGLALAVVGGAFVGVAGPWPLAACGVLVAAALRRPLVVILLATLLASFLSARAASSQGSMLAPRAVVGQIQLATDPEPAGSGLRFDARVDGQLVEVWAWGPQGARLRERLAGEAVQVRGRVEALPDTAEWSRRRGVKGRLTLDHVGTWSGGALHYEIANRFRRLVESGASSLDIGRRALFTGFVYGDDRRQSVVTADDFRAAGLTHLLAVSGQNVAFVVALLAPAASRLGPRGRLVVVALGLLLFATVTRFEPSVLRATAMAGLAAVAAGLGREASSRRILALAITGLVLLDPSLVRSLAFQLSVLASGGILFFSAPLARLVPGPRLLATALAVTVSAQVATAPLLAATFGGVPVASVPANLLAGPVSGPIMIWGMTAGVVAGLVGGWVAVLIHVPTSLMLVWVEAIAARAATAPLGELGVAHLVGLALLVSAGVSLRFRVARTLLGGLGVAVLLHPAFSMAQTPPLYTVIGPDTALWRSDGVAVLVVGPRTGAASLLGDIRRAGAKQIDLAVFTDPGRNTAVQLRAIKARAEVGTTMGPTKGSLQGFRVPADGSTLSLGALAIVFHTQDGRLEAQISQVAG